MRLIRVVHDADAIIDLTVDEFDRIARREGWVKLDDIDVEGLRPHVETYQWWKATGYSWPRDDGPQELYALAEVLLAALDKGDTDV